MVLEKLKEKGFLYVIEILIDRVVPEWLFRCGRTAIYKIDLQRASSVRSSIAEIQVCRSQDLSQLREMTFNDSDEKDTVVAVCAKIDAEMIGGFWAAWSFYRDYPMGVLFDLDDDQGWMYAGFVEKDHRRKGIYSDIIRELSSVLSQRGINRQYFAVSVANKPSMAASKKIADSIGCVTSIKMFGVVVGWSSGQLKQNRSISFKAFDHPIELVVDQ